jgi:transmembrane sensor
MKDIKNTDGFTDKEWDELASILSGEKRGDPDLLKRFSEEDSSDLAGKWGKFSQMNSEIDEDTDVDNAWNNLYSKLDDNSLIQDVKLPVIRRTSNILLRIAASVIVILGLGAAFAYFGNTGFFAKKTVLAAGNEQKNILVSLPDGSRVFLNRNSEFIYNSNYGKRRREVKLTGEAYFEIAPDKSKPFVIDAGKARIKVVGTSFNVITKNVDSAVEVYVTTGRVMLSDNSGNREMYIDPGFIGTMNSNKSGKEMNNNVNYLSWQTGLLEYNGQKLDVVFRDLRRVYNMEIIADESEILENRWTSPIDNQSPDTIIKLICASFNLSYTKDGNVYHLSKK